ncbi:MAG: CbrC family protein [Lachnospiraceae bacterium]|nr:CbrC family protein [Lachnospiraceae bacterium]
MEIEITPVYEMNPASEREPAVDVLRIPPEEIEPLCTYNILKNDEEQLLIIVPGYFKGEPVRPEIHYNAGQHAILARGPHQVLLLDDLNAQVRGALAASERVLVRECDSKRMYTANLIRSDIGPFSRRILEAHRYFFAFHPFPIHDGTLNIGEAVCDYCHTPVKIYYRGRTDGNEVKCACPNCLENSEPIAFGDSFFPEIDGRCITGENWSEVYGATVPYEAGGRVPAIWGVHCGSLGVYLGKLEPEDLIPDLMAELKETWDNELNIHREEDPERVLTDPVRTRTESVHLFRCPVCVRVFCIFVDESRRQE